MIQPMVGSSRGNNPPPHFKPMAAFMKLGDIRGESVVAPDRADQDYVVEDNGDQVAQFKPGDVRDHNHGNRTNWDVICDLGTAIKQTSVADALTDYRPFSEMNQGVVAAGVFSELDQGFVAADPFSALDQGFETGLPVGSKLRSDNRF